MAGARKKRRPVLLTRLTRATGVTIAFAQQHDIDLALRAMPKRTFRLTLGGEPVWIKRPRRGPGYTMYGLQTVVAALLAVPLLQPPRVSRGAAGLLGEARRLARLARKGWPVPSVIDVSDRWLVLRDNGSSLAQVLRGLPAVLRADMLGAALEFQQSLHAEGGWHGAGQVRNFTVVGRGFGLVDFEDDVEPSMPLARRQARDILLFLTSAARFAKGEPWMMEALLAAAHRQASPQVASELWALAPKLVGLRRLLGPLALWTGPDGRAIAALAEAYRNLPSARSPDGVAGVASTRTGR
jgi:hypothetical protein